MDVVVELPDAGKVSFLPVAVPVVENGAEKLSVILRQNRVAFPPTFLSQRIKTGNELKLGKTHVLESVVDPMRLFCCLGGDYAKGIELDPVLLQKFQIPADSVEGTYP